MDSTKFQLVSIRQDITEHSLQLKAIVQDTNACVGPLAKLNSLNGAGRAKISQLRQFIDRFSNVAKDTKDAALLKELALYREQLAASMELFKRANIRAMLAIERNAKEELYVRDPDAVLRQRQKRDKEELAKATSSVTDQLLSISRQLAETTRKSAATLDTLVVSSDGVVGAQEELKLTSDSITQSGKLLAKYGRREFTDKILMFFAFAFFVACVLYIVRKRLF
ncbi:LOW QUALITY PROTEIN: vesicle transport protein SEC20 [Atheta coriaria]|uniref:LOW QUALITY PROTEIN: vesicle transport protein SEC20 n=1 Tax=Dalotia coriaria TaxID=877792 RepID=UPI0031F44E84